MVSKRKSRSSSRGSKAKYSRSRSRSRSKNRSRGRSPGRRKAVSTPSNRTTRSQSSTPSRMSARLAAKLAHEDVTDSKMDSAFEQDIVREKRHKSKRLEFGGPIGTLLMMFFLPATVYYINLACTKESCSIKNLPKWPGKWSAFLDLEAALIVIGWFTFQAVLYMLPIGRVVYGPKIAGGHNESLKYRCNGFYAYVISLLGFAAAVYYKIPVTIVYDKFLQLISSAVILSLLLAVFVYVKARKGAKVLAPGGKTGNVIYDFFMGHELNPRIGKFDIKFFCEMRPGLIGWVMINLAFLVKDYQRHGFIDHNLALVVILQAFYIADGLWFEDGILTTMDIMYEGFGFMLCFGDLVWVPFLYSLQGRYLVNHPYSLPWYCLAGIVFLFGVGYFIFRGSNYQKNEFRKNPNNPALAHLHSIPTKSGKQLLVSGWWGLCRKPNYLGDIIMAIAWSLPCGFSSILPYFYPIYFAILLVHRQRRDEALCKKKYGSSWDRYCEKVQYRIIPHVY